MRDLSIQGKTTTFKTLAILKILHLGLITSVPAIVINQLNMITKNLFGKEKNQNKKLYLKKYLRITWSEGKGYII